MIPARADEWAWDKVAGDLGDAIVGRVPGRTSRDEVALFKSVGLAVQDMSVARIAFDEAVKRGIGTEFQFSLARGAPRGASRLTAASLRISTLLCSTRCSSVERSGRSSDTTPLDPIARGRERRRAMT